MKYQVLVTKDGAKIAELPEAYVHFGHHDFSVVWNKETNRQESKYGVPTFYGGMGEGSTFDNWTDALHASLYDLFQVSDSLHDGDTFTATYQGQTQDYVCSGFEVIKQ